MTKEFSDIIISPILTQKATQRENQYVFKVRDDANKTEIKKAVEKKYKVKVKKVRIIKVLPKKRRRGLVVGEKKGFKKAIVILKEGKIDFSA
jgi:large subunit ribosomal protein L23